MVVLADGVTAAGSNCSRCCKNSDVSFDLISANNDDDDAAVRIKARFDEVCVNVAVNTGGN